MKINLKDLPLNQETLSYLDGILYNTGEMEAWRKNVLAILQDHGYPSNVKITLDHRLIAHIELAWHENTNQYLGENYPADFNDWASELPDARKIMKELPARFKNGTKITLNEQFIIVVDEASSVVSNKKKIAEPAVSGGDYFSRGIAYGELGKRKDALACYNKAIELGENKCLISKAKVLIRLKKKEEAVQVYNEALTQTDNFYDLAYINYKLACLEIPKKDYVSAVARFSLIMLGCKKIMKIGRMNKENIYLIKYEKGNKINTFYLYDLIIRVISELKKVPKKQPREVLQLQKGIVSVADEILLKLKKWIEETKQMSV